MERGIASRLGIVAHRCHWQWHHDEMMWTFVIGHRSRHYFLSWFKPIEHWVGSVCIYVYIRICIYLWGFFLSFPLIGVQFVMWQKTFLWSMFHLNMLASCLCLIKPRWCKIKFLSCQWRFKWGSFLCTFHAYSSILSICVICNKTVEEKKA